MAFHKIDMENWPRREFYQHYMEEVACGYSICVNMDITSLRDIRLYPAMLWLLTGTVNEFQQFRTHLSEQGLGYFDTMNPGYTIYNRETETFSAIWSEYCPEYAMFEKRYIEDVEKYRNSTSFAPKPGRPENTFDVSMIPWTTFIAFNLNIPSGAKYLLPIFTMGKYYEENGRRYLPLAIQVHHAVCDGYHASCFIEQLQQKINLFRLESDGLYKNGAYADRKI